MSPHRIYSALVSFERIGLENSILPPQAQGAVGYMCIAAPDKDAVVVTLQNALLLDGLHLLDVQNVCETSLEDFPIDLDDHLAENMKNWEPNTTCVWGTIHVYLADGET